jgi:hypothetical protein
LWREWGGKLNIGKEDGVMAATCGMGSAEQLKHDVRFAWTVAASMLCITALVGALGCGESNSSSSGATSGQPGAKGSDVAVSKAATALPTDPDIRAFARSMETAVERGQLADFTRAIDWDAIVDKAIGDFGLSPRVRSAYRRRIFETMRSESGFSGQILQNVATGGSFRFLRVRELDGQKSVLFRLIGPSGVNYYELLLSNESERLKADDIYIFLSAEKLTQTMRRAALPLAEVDGPTGLRQLTKTDVALLENYQKFSQMTELVQGQRSAEGMAIYRELPPELQRDKNVLLMRYQAAVGLGEEETVAALDDFRRYHPNDVGLDFMLIDYFVAKKEYAKALESVDRLGQAVGGDAYLDSLRAKIALQQGDGAAALQLAEKAVAAVPDLTGPRFTLIEVLLAAKDHGRALVEMQEVERRFPVEFGDLNENPMYADFVKSPQGEEWRRVHRR